MSDAQAGTPPASQDGTPPGGTPASTKDGSEKDAQKWEEALKWKQKAEDYNKLAEDKKTLEARNAEMERLLYSRGAGQATDPQTEMVAKLREAAPYDPASAAALYNMEQAAVAQAEVWLMGQLMSVPEVKRERVAALVRNSNYRMGVNDALSMVTDPETKTLAERLEEAQREIARIKNAQPNGKSPSSTAPATSDAGEDGGVKEIKRSEYIAILKEGGQRAHNLMKAVGENRTKLVNE